MIVLTWLRQLQQFFFTQEEMDINIDWNIYGRYAANKKINPEAGLEYIYMSKANSDNLTPVTNFSYLKPNKERTGVVPSLEQWTAGILVADIPHIQKDAIHFDSDTKSRFQRSKQPAKFELSTIDYAKKNKQSTPKNAQPITESTRETLINNSLTTVSKLSDRQKYKSIAIVINDGIATTNKKKTARENLKNLTSCTLVPTVSFP